MLDFTWKVFCMTGSVDTYLLLKEIEDNGDESEEARTEGEPTRLDLTADWNQPFV
ncbi:MAG TPA: YqzL family protein [Bacillales bacterium]|nr:YqzL family protein [Bacillales bacterium]